MHLVGNIAVPALEVLPHIKSTDIVVYELSSFQLWDIEKSPTVAVVLMIEPDHLDKHDSLNDYVAAKARIVRYQSEADSVIYNQNNHYSSAIAQRSVAKKVPYPVPLTESQLAALRLPGQHNQQNASAAILAVKALLPEVSEQAIDQGLAGFTGLPHRLKFVDEKNGVRFYDDSISTTPGSAIAALKAFDAPKVLILGGHDKGADYGELVATVAQSTTVRAVVTVGENAENIAHLLHQAGLDSAKIIHPEERSMIATVKAAYAQAISGDVVVLSPAAASFDQYKNYADRGDQFVKAISQL